MVGGGGQLHRPGGQLHEHLGKVLCRGDRRWVWSCKNMCKRGARKEQKEVREEQEL